MERSKTCEEGGTVSSQTRCPLLSGPLISLVSRVSLSGGGVVVVVVVVVMVVAFPSRARILGECSTIHSPLALLFLKWRLARAH